MDKRHTSTSTKWASQTVTAVERDGTSFHRWMWQYMMSMEAIQSGSGAPTLDMGEEMRGWREENGGAADA